MKILALLVVLGCAACEPTFKSESGALTIDGSAFRATTCHVLVTGGLVLTDATGAHLELTTPPRSLAAKDEIRGPAQVRFEPAGQPAVSLGACGDLALRGEAYHAQGKRAASGVATLTCSGPPSAVGELTFAGCF